MSLVLLKKSIGVHADAICGTLGHFLHQAAVVERARINKNNLYDPDPSLFPADWLELQRNIRKVWREYDGFSKWHLDSFDGSSMDSSSGIRSGFFDHWHCPLLFSQLAYSLRPRDPLAAITYATNLILSWRLGEARQLLLPIAENRRYSSKIRTRAYRNLAAVFEIQGEFVSSVHCSRQAMYLASEKNNSVLDYWCYSVSSGQNDAIWDATHKFQQVLFSRSLIKDLIFLTSRRRSFFRYRLEENPKVANLVFKKFEFLQDHLSTR